MKLIVPDSTLKDELAKNDLSQLISQDKSKTQTLGQGPSVGNAREKAIDPIVREMVALDAIDLRQKDVAVLHGVTQSTVSDSENGKVGDRVDVELKAKVNNKKFQIKDLAVSKLMSTLDLFQPQGLENQMEVITAASKLSGIVEKLEEKQADKGNAVNIVFYNPRQNVESKYDTIDV
jgi:transcriptional regulator with XRE-family HTH domain